MPTFPTNATKCWRVTFPTNATREPQNVERRKEGKRDREGKRQTDKQTD